MRKGVCKGLQMSAGKISCFIPSSQWHIYGAARSSIEQGDQISMETKK